MARAVAPLWLARPSRFAGLSKARARAALAILILLIIAALTSLTTPIGREPARKAGDQTDVLLYSSIVDGVRHGGNYYQVAANALREGQYPLRPFVTFRLPTLALIEAALPKWATVALLYALCAGVFVAWLVRLRSAFSRAPPLIVALALLIGGMMAFVQADLIFFHEIWAGLLIALSLALRRPGRWVEACAVGAIALLIRETAALYIAIMAILAWRQGERSETIGWSLVIALFAIIVALHANAVAQVVQSLDPHSPGWSGMLGFGYFVKTMTLSTALLLAPEWLGALLVAFALFGWASWRDPLASRAFSLFVAFALLLGLFGRADTFYWGLMVAPNILVGLAFAPDGLRDLLRAALDRRRVIVTKAVR